ncbi:apolipoprotein N-acyltransferase [Salinispira pacifica]
MKNFRIITVEPDHRAGLFERLNEIFINIGLITLSALLFALSFPNVISVWGFYPLAFVALVPLFVVVHRASWVAIFPYGFFAGFISYVFLNYWLVAFHPLTIFIVPGIYAFYFLLLLPVLKAADSLMPAYGYLLQLALWLGYEYLRTLGFLGYSYGIMGYSQSLFLPLARLSALTGVWGVSLLVVFPSAYLGNALKNGIRNAPSFLRRHRIDAVIFLVLLAGAVVYGLVDKSDYAGSREWRVALVQQNVDPWRGGLPAYRESLKRSVRQSEAALKEHPEIVIWSETSFVPAIDYHMRYRDDPETDALVKQLLAFMARQTVPYVIGNDDGELLRDSNGNLTRVDYNAVLLFEKGKIVQTYRKLRLVPFTENFPYRKQLPFIYDALVKADTHFWREGREYTVFNADGVKFSTPICFEDTFGYLSRQFVRHGAQVIVNLTNDSWSYSVPAAMQHMQMAVFRATENKRSVVRSTNGGMTTIIDPNGKILQLFPAFKEGYMVGTVPVYTAETTLYTRWGDWFAVTMLVIALAGLVAAALVRLLRRHRD